jgi:hypothetical protein
MEILRAADFFFAAGRGALRGAVLRADARLGAAFFVARFGAAFFIVRFGALFFIARRGALFFAPLFRALRAEDLRAPERPPDFLPFEPPRDDFLAAAMVRAPMEGFGTTRSNFRAQTTTVVIAGVSDSST